MEQIDEYYLHFDVMIGGKSGGGGWQCFVEKGIRKKDENKKDMKMSFSK